MTKLLTANEVAAHIGLSVKSVRRLTSQQLLPVLKLGKRRVMYDPKDIERWLDTCRIPERRALKR